MWTVFIQWGEKNPFGGGDGWMIDGWGEGPFHLSQNDTGTLQNAILLISLGSLKLIAVICAARSETDVSVLS